MSRVSLVFCAILAVASATDWGSLLVPEKKGEFIAAINVVVDKCAENTGYTAADVWKALEPEVAVTDVKREVACIIECFQVNGPQAMDENGKLIVPEYFDESIKPAIKKCVAELEAQNLQDFCAKALVFRKICLKPHDDFQKAQALKMQQKQ